MDDVYDRIVDAIRNLPQAANRKYAFRALSWIGYATRTLTAQELIAAICVEAEHYQLNDENIYTLEDLLDICNGLVVADEDGQAVRLVHFSARNYLDRSDVIPEDTKETYRAIACSTYLSFGILKEWHCTSQNLDILIRNLSFLDYAANNLAFHLSMVDHGHYPQTTGAILKLLEDKGHRRAYCEANKAIGKQLEISRLNLACAIGYGDAVRTLLEEADVDANVKDTTLGITPLIWAARMGHEAVVKQLLNNCNVDVNAKDTKFGLTALMWAARMGHDAVVKQLLNNSNVDVDAKDTNAGLTPLMWAARKGHEAVVKQLHNNCNVDVNAEDAKFGLTSLSWAVEMGCEAVAKYLLDEGRADRNCKDNSGRTPLSLSIRHGAEISTLLLEKGVEVNFTYILVSQFDFRKL